MPDFDLIIRGGSVVAPSGVQQADIAISDERIVAISPGINANAKEEIDAAGLHIFPGLIDVHVHFNDPGRADWEGAPTGSAALAAGGGTCFFDMPLNSSPPVLDAESFDAKLHALTGNSYADFGLWGGLTPLSLDHMEALAAKGVVGFKAFMCDSGIDDFERVDNRILELGMQKAAALGLPVAVHAEKQEVVAAQTKRVLAEHGIITATEWPEARYMLGEMAAIVDAINCARQSGAKLHIVHISNHFGVDFAARDRDVVDISIETCPHYFTLNAEAVQNIGVTAKCAPPIRTAAETDLLWTSLANGNVDIIGSDHSPSPASMKDESDFFGSWGGIAGVQSTLSSLLTREPRLPLEKIAQLISANPAKRFNIANKGQLAPDFDADLSLVDLSAEYELTRDTLLDRHKLSPYVGMKFRGKIIRTLLRGQTIFLDGKIVSKPRGKFIRPEGAAHV